MTDQDRIAKIEQSIAGLESILTELKEELHDVKKSSTEATPVTEPVPATQTQETSAPEVVPAQKTAVSEVVPAQEPIAPKTTPAQVPSPVQNTAPAASPVSEKKPATQKKSSGLEENLGGKVMGIVAAVLVFVGLLLFGSLMYERLGDPARIASLYLISFLILGAGLFFERKHQSWFTTSLIGCGFGAVYISLFVTCLYFNLYSVEVLYLLLILWLVGIGLYVFRKQSYVVASLGQAGIAFSVIFGCIGVESKGQFMFLCLYFTILSFLYLWLVLWRFLPASKEKPYSWVSFVAAALNLLQLFALSTSHDYHSSYHSDDFGNGSAIISSILCFYTFALPVFFLLRNRRLADLPLLPWKKFKRRITETTFPIYKAGVFFLLFYSFYQFAVFFLLDMNYRYLFSGDGFRGLFVVSGLFLAYIILESLGAIGTESRGACIVTAVMTAISLMAYDFTDCEHALICIVFCLITSVFGLFGTESPVRSVLNRNTNRWEYICKEEAGRCFPKFTAPVYAFLLLFSYRIEENLALLTGILVFAVLYFGGMFLFLYTIGKKHRYADGLKIELYFFTMYYTFMLAGYFTGRSSLESFTSAVLGISVLTLLNGIAYYSRFRKLITNPKIIDSVATVVIRLVQTALWIWSIALLHSGASDSHPLLLLWLIVLSLYMCLSGMYDQYKCYGTHTGLGIYFGLRVTVYMIAVLTAFDSIEGYIISCVLLLLAVIAVLAGFPLRLAALRIYGLFLAMLAVVKLLMIDVEHDNSMETVLCFLGAGILCFAINFIYNHVKKRFNKNAE